MATRKGGRTRTRANTRTQKGKAFENRVAEMYKLLGAKVVQNIEICQKKVDILATFTLPGSTTGHRVIVECKNEKAAMAQNQRIMQFKGLLDVARAAGEADSAAIITRVPWSDQSKAFARKSGIELLTYSQKTTQIINFDAYLRHLLESFEDVDPRLPGEPPLGLYYVGMKAHRTTESTTEEQVEDIPAYVAEWISRDSGPHLAILGEYGTGKTSLCRKLAHDIAAEHFRTDGVSRIPILFNLRDFTKTLSVESLVTSFLDEQCDVQNPKFRLFRAMNEAGVFVLIFDGFDEMAVRVDADTLDANLAEIDRLAVVRKSRVILTSRVKYFITAEEETTALRPKGQLLATREAEYQAITLQPWDDAQIGEFLKRRVPMLSGASHDWTYYRDRIARIPGLADLSKRPVLLDMIVKTLPKLIEARTPIDRPNLYRAYLCGELRRQKIVKKRRLLLSEDTRFSMLENLALDFLTAEAKSINFEKAMECVRKQLKPPKSEVEAYARDFLTCSFLVRRGDDFVFSHRSLLEFLAASALLRELDSGQPRAFQSAVLEPVVAGFLGEMVTNTRTLWHWVRKSKKHDTGRRDYLSGNAVTVLCLKNPNCLRGKDMSGTVLRCADFGEANLLTTDFSGAVVEQCNYAGARVSVKALTKAHMRNCRFSLFVYGTHPRSKRKTSRHLIHEIMAEFPTPYHKRGRHSYLRYYQWQVIPMQDDEHFFGQLQLIVRDTSALQSPQAGLRLPPWIGRSGLDYRAIRQMLADIPEEVRNQLQVDFLLRRGI